MRCRGTDSIDVEMSWIDSHACRCTNSWNLDERVTSTSDEMPQRDIAVPTPHRTCTRASQPRTEPRQLPVRMRAYHADSRTLGSMSESLESSRSTYVCVCVCVCGMMKRCVELRTKADVLLSPASSESLPDFSPEDPNSLRVPMYLCVGIMSE